MEAKTIFDKTYCDDELQDLQRDIIEAFDPRFNSELPDSPKDENGFTGIVFRVVIEIVESNIVK